MTTTGPTTTSSSETVGPATFGVAMPFFDHQSAYPDVLAFALAAGTAGFDGLWVGDHLVVGPAPHSPRTWYDAPTLLAGLAAVVPTLTLGTDVLIVPYRNPIAAAKALATVDIVSGGRLIVGVGVGVDPDEYRTLGVGYRKRGAITDDYLAVWKAVWAREPTAHMGDHYSLDAQLLQPKPVQSPHPPIWIGGNSAAAIRRAATMGDGWQPLALTPDVYQRSADELSELAERSNRRRPTLSYSSMFGAVGARSVSDAQRVPLTGGVQQVVDDIGALRECGVTNFVFRPGHPDMGNPEVLDQVRLLGAEVLPRVRG